MTLQNTLNSFFKTANHTDKVLANQNARQRYAAKKLAKKLNVNLDISRDSYGWSCWVEAEEKNMTMVCFAHLGQKLLLS